MANNETKLQLSFKLDKSKDGVIFDMVNLSDDKTNLIKNALFYYMHEIECGKVRDRYYPYNKINIRIDILPNDDIVLDKETIDKLKGKEEVKEEVIVEEVVEDNIDDNFDDVPI